MRFPGFTDEWKECTIRDIAKIEKGNGISKDQLSEEGDECILYGELYTKYKSEIIGEVYSKTKVDSTKLMRSQANDVLIPCSGETAEDIATARCVKMEGILLGGDLNIMRFDKQDGAFMSYQLNGKRKYDIARVAQGVSVVHLYPEHLKSIKVVLPELEEQQKIVTLLSLIDQRITTQNKIIEDLKKLKSAIIDQIIDSANFPKIRFEELYDKAGEGGTPSTSISEYYTDGTIPFVKIDDLSNKYLFDSKDHITELGLGKSSAWLIPINSILYSNGATIGEISINKTPVCTKQGILGIIPKKEFDVVYLYYFMSSTYFQKQVERIVTEGTMRTAYLKDINHIECPMPDYEKQIGISQILRSFSNKIEIEQRLLTNYIQQKEYLLKSLFI
ncbi:MAG: hypothetical protein HDS91_05795 [Bacteroidales bacterium]|nr:hypothetical protein [Bacteroidales bacterium]